MFPGPLFGEGVLAFVEEVEAVFGGGGGEFGEDGVPVGVAGLAEALEPLLGDFEAAAPGGKFVGGVEGGVVVVFGDGAEAGAEDVLAPPAS